MDTEIKMPDLATTDDTVILVRWLVQVGEMVKLGQPLFEVETDKATMEVEAIAAGVLTSVRVEPGGVVPVGDVIAVISSVEKVTETPASPHPPAPSPSGRRGEEHPSPQAVTPRSEAEKSLTKVTNTRSGEEKPLARQSPIAQGSRSRGEGSQPRQSLFERNRARRQSANETPSPAVSVNGDAGIRLTSTQRAAARRLQQSKQNVPHFYLTLSANAEPMVAVRTKTPGLVWDAVFVQAAARAAADFERMRCRFEDDRLIPIPGGAVGVAADVDDNLFVIPVENPLALSLAQISDHITRQVERIRQGDAAARKLCVTYLTISNLGGAGIEAFAPIINPPEPAILGIGKIAAVPYVYKGGIIIQQRVTLTLAVDHRVASGKYASAFLQRIVSELEAVQ